MGDAGVTFSTTQIIAIVSGVVIALWSALAASFKIIRGMYIEQAAAMEKRIEKMESREEERNRASDRYVEQLERMVEVMSRATGVTEEIVRTTPGRRTSRTGD